MGDVEFNSYTGALSLDDTRGLYIIACQSLGTRDVTATEYMLESLHGELQNEDTAPLEDVTLMLYDVDDVCDYMRAHTPAPCRGSAYAESDISECTAQLIRRHHVRSGMYLMYYEGRLVFGHHILDGYGRTKANILRQASRCLQLGATGVFLPPRFKFTHTPVEITHFQEP